MLAFPVFILDEELAPVKNRCVYMLGDTLLFGSQQYSQEAPMLVGETLSCWLDCGLNSLVHWAFKVLSALRAEIQSWGTKVVTPVYTALCLSV